MTTDYRGVVERHWVLLTSTPLNSATAMRVLDLPVDVQFGKVAVGIDPEGRRHFLVPVDSHHAVRKGLDGPILRLTRRPLETANSYQVYADLECLDPEFDKIFATFCAVALESISESPRSPIKGLYRALDKWKTLFQRSGTLLGPEQVSGLFGELLVLRRLLGSNPSAHHSWMGPTGDRHDFTSGTVAVEVKASLQTEGRKVRVHGLDQLDPPHNGVLLLVWFRFETSTDGVSLQSLVEDVLALSDDEGALLHKLVIAGYRAVDAEHYRESRLRVVEQRWYPVDGPFPRLTVEMVEAAGVAVTVQDVHYSIDLSGESPAPIGDEAVTSHLALMLEERV